MGIKNSRLQMYYILRTGKKSIHKKALFFTNTDFKQFWILYSLCRIIHRLTVKIYLQFQL